MEYSLFTTGVKLLMGDRLVLSPNVLKRSTRVLDIAQLTELLTP